MAEQYWEKYTDGNGIEWGTLLIDYDDVDNAGARGNLSVAIGKANLAYGEMSFAAGCRTKALGAASSSDGIHTVAGGRASHAGGYYTKTTNDAEFAVGRFNESTSDLTIFSVGNGEDDETRSNALEVTLDDKTIVKKLQVLNPGDTTAIAGLGLDEDNNVVLIEGSTSGVNDGKFTITAAGTTISEFTANQEGDTTLDISTDDTLTLTQTQSGILLGVKYYQLIQPLTILANGYDVLEYNPILSETASSLNIVQGEGIQVTYDEGVITISAHLNTPNTPNDGKLFVLAGGVLNQIFTANQSGHTTLSIVGSGGTTVSQSGNTLTISTDEVSEVNDGKLLVLLNNSVIKEFSANQSENTVLLIEIPELYIDQDGILKSNIESANNSKIQVYYDNLLYTELYLNSPYNLSLNLPKIQDAEILVTAQNRILGRFSLNLEEDATIDLSDLISTEIGSPFEEVDGNVRRINSDESVLGDNNISFSTYSYTNTSGFLNPDVLIANSILGVSAKVGDLLAYTYDGDTYSTEVDEVDDNVVYVESPIIPDVNVYNAIINNLTPGARITINIILKNYLGGMLSALLGEYNKLYDGEDSLIGGYNNTIMRSNSSIIAGSSNAVEHSDSESGSFIEDSLLVGEHNDVVCGVVSSLIAGEDNQFRGTENSCDYNIVAGESNKLLGTDSSLIVGTQNESLKASTQTITGAIIGGNLNKIGDGLNNILSGEGNKISSADNSIVSGYKNIVYKTGGGSSSEYSGQIVSGLENDVADGEASIINGQKNVIRYANNSIGVGYGNTLRDVDNCIITGEHHNIYALRSFIGGLRNIINNIDDCLVVGSYNNIEDNTDGSIIGGNLNAIKNTEDSLIVGDGNTIEDAWKCIIGGDGATIKDEVENCLIVGSANKVEGTTDTIIGGSWNTIKYVDKSLIVGSSNKIENTEGSAVRNSIIGGDSNTAVDVDNILMVGESLTVTNNNESTLGQYNQSIEGLTLFSVGNGTNTNRKNALEVTTDDTTIIRKGKILEPLTGTPSTYLALDSNNNIISAAGGTTVETGHIYNPSSDSLAEGVNPQLGTINIASGLRSHAEGYQTRASGNGSHAEGFNTTASEFQSHAEGANTIASGQASHAEGTGTTASGAQSHAEGIGTTASGVRAHAEGANTIASGLGSHAEGHGLDSDRIVSFVCSRIDANEQNAIKADTGITFIYCDRNNGIPEAYGSQGYIYSDADCTNLISKITICILSYYSGGYRDYFNIASDSLTDGVTYYWKRVCGAEGDYSHVEGSESIASGESSHAEGSHTTASGTNSHAEGYCTIVSGNYSHAEGIHTRALGASSHAEGGVTLALGVHSHAEGQLTEASGESSHAEGQQTRAYGLYSHAEGFGTLASGIHSHAEGSRTTASGLYSHAEGYETITNNDGEHTCGRFNNSHSSTANSETIFSIGIGTANPSRKNAVEVTADGYVYITEVGGYHGDESGQNVQTSISLLSYLAALELRILALELQLNNL